MAIQANATRGGLNIPKAYIIISGTRMEKYLCPISDPETGNFLHSVAAVQHQAKVSIYSSAAEREENFGGTEFNLHMNFSHVQGRDPVDEAYAAVIATGIPGWTLTNIEQV